MKKLLLAALVLTACNAGAQSVIRGEVSAGNYANIKVDSSGVMSTALPTDAATATLQTTANTTLSTVSTNISTLTTNSPTLVAGRTPNLPVSVTAPVTWLTSAARTATVTQADQTNSTGAKGIIVYCNVTAVPSIETLTFSLQAKDSLSGVYITLEANTATVATGMITLKLNPSILAVAVAITGQSVQDVLPYTWRLVATHSAAGSWTYSCAYNLQY